MWKIRRTLSVQCLLWCVRRWCWKKDSCTRGYTVRICVYFIISLITTVMEFLANATRRVQLKKVNFFYGFWPIQHVSRIFGLFPYSIEFNPSGTIKKVCLRPWDILWAILTCCLYLSAASIFINGIMYSKVALILHIGFYLIRIMGTLTAALTVVLNIINRHKFIGILKDFADFDNEVSASKVIWKQFQFSDVGHSFSTSCSNSMCISIIKMSDAGHGSF